MMRMVVLLLRSLLRVLLVGLALTGGAVALATVSPPGRWVAYTLYTADGAQVAVQDVDRRLGCGVSMTSTTLARLPSWSPDGQQLAFQRIAAAQDDIHAYDFGGNHADLLLPDVDRHNRISRLVWSPDGSRIVFTSKRSLYIYDVASGEHHRLLDSMFVWKTITWSPDGAQVAFSTIANNDNGVIFRLDVRDGALTALTDADRFHEAPVWSPDGAQIAYAANAGTSFDIYVQAVAGGGARRLTHHSAHDFEPQWSPDGTQIAFTSDRAGGRELYLVTVADGSVTRLTDSPGFKTGHAWSPDGSLIAFTARRSRVTNSLYTVAVDSGTVTPLVAGCETDELVVWRP